MTGATRESVSALPSSKPVEAVNDNPLSVDRSRLVLVDDDGDYREAVGGELNELGFDTVDFAAGAPMLDYFGNGGSADIVVLDWKLSGQTGLDLLRQLRRRGIQVPVVILTGVSTESYEAAALDCGALDFVDKTRGPAILARRLRLILESGKRPAHLPEEDRIDVGALELRPKVCRAFWNGVDVHLTVTEFNIVHLLASHAGEDMTYRAIYDRVHRAGFIAGSGDDGFRTNVRSCVKRIRNKFKAIDADFAEIENFAGFGYRWRRGSAHTG
jgi:two-component system, OmpR family, response regulator ChvI